MVLVVLVALVVLAVFVVLAVLGGVGGVGVDRSVDAAVKLSVKVSKCSTCQVLRRHSASS